MSERWRIVIGSDAAGLVYKDVLKTDLEADPRVVKVNDVGVRIDQVTPSVHVATAAAREVTEGRADRALLICGAGLGVAMSANTVSGIRAVTASDSSAVERSVLDNDAQVLCFGHQVISLELARRLAHEWLGYRFDPDPHVAHNVFVIGRPGVSTRGGGDPPLLVNLGCGWGAGGGALADRVGDDHGDDQDHQADPGKHREATITTNVVPFRRMGRRGPIRSLALPQRSEG
jgi:ribose 5-phosphate isomerase B